MSSPLPLTFGASFPNFMRIGSFVKSGLGYICYTSGKPGISGKTSSRDSSTSLKSTENPASIFERSSRNFLSYACYSSNSNSESSSSSVSIKSSPNSARFLADLPDRIVYFISSKFLIFLSSSSIFLKPSCS